MTFDADYGIDDLSPFQIHSKREIVALLRNISESKQLVRMLINGGTDAIVTSILKVDEAGHNLLVDCAPSAHMNQRIVESDNISFETVLEHIRILFFSTHAESSLYENLPAFRLAIPDSMIRLQRRQFYRVKTPIANPLQCAIQIPHENERGVPIKVMVTLHNVSGGGIAIVDEKRLLDNTIGQIYSNCQIGLPGGTLVVASLQIRNSHEITLPTGRTIRRLGCLFIDLPKTMLAAVQRYITKLERDRNARETGMR